ncbi:MAG: hypothetical protein AABX04_02865, partial [Nanoarchaeota archaeon]
NVECTRRYEVCIVAYDGNRLVNCGARITGNYTCLCNNPSRVTGAIPTGGTVTPKKSPVTNSCSKIYCTAGNHCENGKCVSNFKQADVPSGVVSTGTSSSSSGSGVSVGKVGGVDISRFSPEAKSTYEQLSRDIQDKIGIVYQNPEDFNKLFNACKGSTDCIVLGVDVKWNSYIQANEEINAKDPSQQKDTIQ